MKNKLFILLLLSQFIMKAQIATYDVDLSSDYAHCYIDLYDNGFYQIRNSISLTIDVLCYGYLSQGNYIIEDGMLKTKDSLLGFEMLFRKNEGGLTAIKSFDFLKKCEIREIEHRNGKFEDIYSNNLIENPKGTINGTASGDKVASLKTGWYYESICYEGISLLLDNDKTFKLSFFDNLFSTGVWFVKDDMVCLQDTILGFTSEFLCEDDRLVSVKMPGDCGGTCLLLSDGKKSIGSIECEFPPIIDEEDDVLIFVDEMPAFVNGMEELLEFIKNNVKYPTEARDNSIHGKVFIGFVVERDGSLSNIKVLRGIGYGCDEEACRVVSMMPKWKPGKHKGELVRVRYLVPVVF